VMSPFSVFVGGYLGFKKMLGNSGRTIAVLRIAIAAPTFLLDDNNSARIVDAIRMFLLLHCTYLLVGAVHEQHRLGGVIKHSSKHPTIPAFYIRVQYINAGRVRARQYRWTYSASILYT
jgi:hypothetical protein